ncbi:MAG: S-layer homology domain-containing protein [Actinomycetota bacterium]
MRSPHRRRLPTFAVALAILIAAPLAVVASDAFDDVDDSNVHHDDITWLADNGVTAGCNPPDNTEFCPGDPVLRQQMASFMRRLAENQVVDAATAQTAETADDADTLDGQDGTAYSTVVAAATCSDDLTDGTTSCGSDPSGSVPDETTIEVLSADLEAPVPGTIVVDAHTRSTLQHWLTLNETCADVADTETLQAQILNGLVLFGPERASGSTAVEVGAGTHTIRLCGVYANTDGGGLLVAANLVTEWTANGSVETASAPDGVGTLENPFPDDR